MTEETSILLNELNLEKTRFSLASNTRLITNFDISPQDFIKYAEFDLASKYEHNIVNALSNSKRALDCQLDSLLFSFGYYQKSQKGFWSFPKKLDLIKDFGVIAPRVLKKINKQRNLLEHQFIKPEKETVEDFLDIAMLFIASTDQYILRFVDELHLKNEEIDKTFVIQNDYKNSAFRISEFKNTLMLSVGEERREECGELPLKVHMFSLDDIDYNTILLEYLKRIR